MFLIEAMLFMLVAILGAALVAGWVFLMVLAYVAFGWPGLLIGLVMSAIGWHLAEK